ncbi:hypothetical protein KJ966_08320 [bacterium]|nr:hypothetical protein [bacterium]
MTNTSYDVDIIDVSGMDYSEQILVASLQGLINRVSPRVFVDYGQYDDVESRTTNEVFIPEDIWRSTYRDAIGNQDQNNLKQYQTFYDFKTTPVAGLPSLISKFAGEIKGLVVWDPNMQDTINIALMLSATEDLLVADPQQIEWLDDTYGLKVKQDLRNRWSDRVILYQWAFENLFRKCSEGRIACVEPGWKRPEFADYIVQNKVFVYSLTTQGGGLVFSFGQKLLMLLVGGPYALRNTIFKFGVDLLLRKLGLFLMGLGSRETRLATQFQRAVKRNPYPTIFGWHTKRDDEFAFMLHLSANGLRLVPCHLAGNFSFHSKLPALSRFKQRHAQKGFVRLEKDKTYLTFTLSDGDQLVLMNTSQLGNWNRKERGKVPFNWEIQPLLADLAPGLLSLYYESLTENDYLIAGPSGAGYIVPPLAPDLETYMKESERICKKADIRTMTSYIGDPSSRVICQHGKTSDWFLGFLGGYLHFGRTPMVLANNRAFIANAWPPLENIADTSEQTLEGVRKLLNQPEETPRFIGVHLFAYRTTISDVYRFVQSLDAKRVKVVKADEFLLAAARYLSEEKKPSIYIDPSINI